MPLDCARCGRATPGLLACDDCAAARRPAQIEALDYFTLFGLPRGYGLDRAALERAYVGASKALHPDRFVAEARAAARRLQARVNEAYAVLKDADRRARYLIALEGGAETADDRSVPEAFLERQLELRERAAGAAPEALATLRGEAAAGADETRVRLEAALAAGRWRDARRILNELQFYRSFLKQADEQSHA